ncbi:MAG TPA: VIT domain-containing protein [Prolixibacteraceae bacterium]|nr:VIT domain-containing protein [Prolixibacteraceae bacterium]
MKPFLTIIAALISMISPGQIPTLTVQNSNHKQNLEISQLNVNVIVAGNVATTTLDIIFYNPLSRNLEGELTMPLAEGQELCRYALDINGKLREGVVVEKVKARQAFEAVIRQNIDPGIVNLTKGNSFNTKIFPIPAKGNKRVVLALSETLQGDEKNLYYSLPFASSQSIGSFKLDVKVIKSRSGEKAVLSDFENIRFDSQNDAHLLNFERKNYTAKGPLKFTIPRFSDAYHQLFTCHFEGQTYFYLNVKTPILKQNTKEIPRKIAVYWDHSFSAARRSVEKELNLLESYLSSLKGTKEVTLICFNHRVSPSQIFRVNQDAGKVIESIRQLKNDGATCLDHLKFDGSYDEILMFSDAVNTIGETNMVSSEVPVYTFSSGNGSNYSLLKRLASKTKGEFIDLNVLSVEKALDLLKTEDEMFLSCTIDPSRVKEVYPKAPCRVNEYFELSGILITDKADITLNYGTRSKITQSQTFQISKASEAPVARLWASKKIQSLAIDQEANEKEIMALAQKFNIVTSNTAFIVLDRVEDYVAHGIIPPDELKEEYNKLLMTLVKPEETSPKHMEERNSERVNQLKAWYTSPPKVSNQTKSTIVEGIDEEQSFTITSVMEVSDQVELEAVSNIVADNESDDIAPLAVLHEPSIKVLAWLPDAPYLKELRSAGNKDLDSLYYKLKEENMDRPSFYIQVADFFFEKKMKDKAIRVLSNTLELDLENPELLKVVARRLLQEGEYETAVKVFNEIKKLRPEEPQSFRDLALAYQAMGNYQEALDTYLFMMDHNWNRFDAIKDVILNELNHLISLHQKQLDLKAVNPTYIHPMPLDIRITVDWSSNENDIDLWVIDPNGEKCFYSHPNTEAGGKISHDFTRGYGPEEFTLKTAKRGTYTVYVNYFSESRQTITGPVTIYATMTTHYGTAQEQTKPITVQLVDNKETRQIGQLEFDN